jgi:hypothetical protein
VIAGFGGSDAIDLSTFAAAADLVPAHHHFLAAFDHLGSHHAAM